MTGWGRLSKAFLTEIYDDITQYNILTALKDTNDNLMQLLSIKYTFSENIEKFNSFNKECNNKFNYENLVSGLMLSPSVKRPVWQTLLILKEIIKIVDRNKLYDDVCLEFVNEFKKGSKLSCVLVTQTGKPQEKVIGILTSWDILGR